MRNEKSSNSDICFLVLSRPADTLSALVSSILPNSCNLKSCQSIYHLITALQEIEIDRPSVLIARAVMLTCPDLVTTLEQYRQLQIIGWMGNHEKLSEPVFSAVIGCGVTMVSNIEQLCRIITTYQKTIACQPALNTIEVSKQDSKIEPADYRLSNEELDALLGAER